MSATEKLAYALGAALVIAIGWVAIGLVARVIQYLFCLGYGCN